MNLSRKGTIRWVSLFMLMVVLAPIVSADHGDKRHRRRERKHHENHFTAANGVYDDDEVSIPE